MDRKIIAVIFIALSLIAAVILDGGFLVPDYGKNASETSLINSKTEAANKNLSSFFTNKGDYETAFSYASNVRKNNVLAGITSHHFLARDLIARFFSGIESSGIDNVVIVGPDHFEALKQTKADAAATKLSWNTPFGQLDPNKEMQDDILAAENIIENDSVFRNEHSIYTLIPFVKKAFPEAQIIPLIIQNSSDYEKFIGIGNNIREIAGNRTLLIVSSDFSHNALIAEAEKNDQASIKILKSLSQKNIGGITSDCKSCMAVLYGFLKNDSIEFYLSENKNSSDFGSQDKTVTSYVSGYYLK